MRDYAEEVRRGWGIVEADRLAVQEECAMIPLMYARISALLQPWVHGWWSWGVPWQSYDELQIDERSPRFTGPSSKEEANA